MTESASIRGWVAQAPAGMAVRAAQMLLLAWAGSAILVQLIPVPSPSAMNPLQATLYVVHWLVVTLWIPVGALVWGRRRRGFLYASALLVYSVGFQLLGDWQPWLAAGAFPGARRALKLGLTLAALAACLIAAPKQPE